MVSTINIYVAILYWKHLVTADKPAGKTEISLIFVHSRYKCRVNKQIIDDCILQESVIVRMYSSELSHC